MQGGKTSEMSKMFLFAHTATLVHRHEFVVRDLQLLYRSSVCYSVAQASSISALIPAGVLIVAFLQLALIWSNYHIQFFVLLMITIITISFLCIPWQEHPSLLYPESHVHA
jgi:hypothetical protein